MLIVDAFVVACQGCCVSTFSMAVPFVQDWDLVQTLGEGAYGEYDSSFIFVIILLKKCISVLKFGV